MTRSLTSRRPPAHRLLASAGIVVSLALGSCATPAGDGTPTDGRTPAEICGCAVDMPGCLCAHCLGMPEPCPCHDEEGNLKPEATQPK